MTLKAPFPYFGGKSAVAPLVWARLGSDCRNYIEPFCGSLAMLLGRPTPFAGVETVNDACGFISNFWRATQHDPESVATWADNPVNENDLHARHAWLVKQADELTARLEGDPDYFDAKIAGWWCWGLCCWIGSGWCSGKGPWSVVDGRLVKGQGQCLSRRLPHIGSAGQGVNRQRPHLNAGVGVKRPGQSLVDYFAALRDRIKDVQVCCGDWERICGPSPLGLNGNGKARFGTVAVFLDPPYADTANRDDQLYRKDSLSVAHDVREWAIAHGDNPRLRIALCGYEGEHVMPDDWECVAWKAQGGMANHGNKGRDGTGNCRRERIWFSPHCLKSGDESIKINVTHAQLAIALHD